MVTIQTARRPSATSPTGSFQGRSAEAKPFSNGPGNALSPNGVATPPKGYFSPAPSRATTATNSNFIASAKPNDVASSPAPSAPSAVKEDFGSSESRTFSRPRRESSGQMRRKASDSAAAAGSGGGIGIAFANRTVPGQPISTARSGSRGFSTSPRPDTSVNGVSSSFGAAAEALSLPAAVLNSGAKSGRSTGHTHFGQECFGPEPGESIPNPPASAMKGSTVVPASAPDGSSVGIDAGSGRQRAGSISSSVAGDDESAKNGKDLPIHRCESCSKIYRHPSCLVKHRWEHTVYWKEASKFLMSKHQQVQLLEAAAILVNLDGDAASLPDEKALWPAAVSPASSGLLGSDKVNFDKLMQRKATMRGRASSSASETSWPASARNSLASSHRTVSATPSMPRSASGGMSPLNSFTKLGISGTPLSRPAQNGPAPMRPHSLGHSQSYGYTLPYSYSSSSRLNGDFHRFTLDESDERTPATETLQGEDGSGSSSKYSSADDKTSDERSGRSRSADTEDDILLEDDEDDLSNGSNGLDGGKKWGLHEDAVAEMDLEE